MRLLAAAVLLAGLGCGRYDDFRLPAPTEPPASGAYHWEPHPAPVLARGAAGEWDAIDTLNPSVVRHAGQYFNFYSGFDGKTWHTGLALSPDGLTWTRKGKTFSPQAAWEGDYIAANGAALRVGTQFYYWYQAGGRTPRIGLARSADGVSWAREPAPVLDLGPRGSWDEMAVADPYVISQDGWLYLFYLGQDRARRQRLGVARSQDGVVWTKLRSNPILELGEYGAFDEYGLGEPAVWRAHGRYWMLYTGRDRHENRRMGFASSTDGVHWSRHESPVIAGAEHWNAKVVCDATVEPVGPDVRVWFGGGDVASPDERLNGQIGYGMLRWRPAN